MTVMTVTVSCRLFVAVLCSQGQREMRIEARRGEGETTWGGGSRNVSLCLFISACTFFTSSSNGSIFLPVAKHGHCDAYICIEHASRHSVSCRGEADSVDRPNGYAYRIPASVCVHVCLHVHWMVSCGCVPACTLDGVVWMCAFMYIGWCHVDVCLYVHWMVSCGCVPACTLDGVVWMCCTVYQMRESLYGVGLCKMFLNSSYWKPV